MALPARWHLVTESNGFLRIAEGFNGRPGGTAAAIGSVALCFRPRRHGSHRGEKMRYDTFTPEDLEIARLVAGAPELLKALETVTNCLEDEEGDDSAFCECDNTHAENGTKCRPCFALDAARAALAKVTG